jgi:hypothetical protein
VTDPIGIGEKPSDFLVEQGLLVGMSEYFVKSYVLKESTRMRNIHSVGCKTVRVVGLRRTAITLANRGEDR